MTRRTVAWAVPALALGLLTGGPEPVLAQTGGPGFLFKQPIVTVSVRTGYAMPFAESEIFDHTIEQLTLDRGDFAGGHFAGEIAVRLADRLDMALGVQHSSTSNPSEFRDWVDLDDNPIEQITDLSVTTMSLSAKYYLAERGRAIGRFAWIPTRVHPFVGAGLGLTHYDFLQRGDWVDFETLDIFNTRFRSDDMTGSAHGFAGVELSLNKNLAFSGEARYTWAKGELDRAFFEGFDKMDLSGVHFAVGITARF